MRKCTNIFTIYEEVVSYMTLRPVPLNFLIYDENFSVENTKSTTTEPVFVNLLKVHKHEIFLNFFFTYIKSLYALGKFSKKISLSFLRFSPEFRSSNIYTVAEHTRNQIFLRDIQKFFFSKSSLWSY